MGAIQQALSGAANAAIGVAGTLKAKEMVDEQRKANEESQLANATLGKVTLDKELSKLDEDIARTKKGIEFREAGNEMTAYDYSSDTGFGNAILTETPEVSSKRLEMMKKSLSSLEEEKTARLLQRNIYSNTIERITGGKK